MIAKAEYESITETEIHMSASLLIRQRAVRRRPRSVADLIPPEVSNSELGTDGLTLTIEFDEDVTVEDFSGFVLSATGGEVTLSPSMEPEVRSITYQAGRIIADDEVLSLAYTLDPGQIVDNAGNRLVAFSGLAVTNNSEQSTDTTPPEVVNAVLDPDGQTFVVSFDEDVTGSTGMSIAPSGEAATLSFVGSGGQTITYSSSRTIEFDETLTLSGTGGDIEDIAGNALQAFADFPVTNNSQVGAPSGDPDLPATFDTSLPDNWDDPADHTPADAAALHTLLASGTIQPGDVVELTTGQTYVGRFTIPASLKGTLAEPIIFRSSGFASLPVAGNRVAVSDAQFMATLAGPDSGGASNRVLDVEASDDGSGGASFIRFLGIDFTSTNNQDSDFANLMVIGPAGIDGPDQPDHIVFDRCLIHGDTLTACRNAMSLNVKRGAVIDSRFYEIHSNGENGGVCVILYTGLGPTIIRNNTLSATGVPVFLGAQGPNSPIPLDISVTHNEIIARDDQDDDWGMKNKIETKNCVRVLIEDNVLKGGINSDQLLNDAIYLKAAGTGSLVQHVTCRWNLISNTEAVLSIQANDDAGAIGVLDVLVENNLAYDADNIGQWKVDFLESAVIRLNTFSKRSTSTETRTPQLVGAGDGAENLTIKDNILDVGPNYPFKFTGTAQGVPSLNAVCSGPYSLLNNLIRGVGASNYNGGAEVGSVAENNQFPSTTEDIGFVDPDNGDYELSDGSTYATASSTGGKPGCDVPTLMSRTANVESGVTV